MGSKDNTEYSNSPMIYIISAIVLTLFSLAAFSQPNKEGEKINDAHAVGVVLVLGAVAVAAAYVLGYRNYILTATSFQIVDFWGRTETEVNYSDIDKIYDHETSGINNRDTPYATEYGHTDLLILKTDGEAIKLDVSGLFESSALIKNLRQRVYGGQC